MMKTEVFKFKFFDMPVSVTRSAVISSLVLAVVLIIASVWFTNLLPFDALIAGIVGTLLHWFGCLVHHYGHFFAAKRTGYPSTDIVLWGLLGTTRYPKNEVKLAPAIHIRRAVGGPIASLILSVLVGLLAAAWLWSYSEFSRFISAWMLLDYIGVFTVGALFPPLTFNFLTTDGGTIWQQMRQK
jgi:hypothetical protein